MDSETALACILSNLDRNICICGPGGTGKTHLMGILYHYMTNTLHKTIAVTASTGIAARSLGNKFGCVARTIHSWSGCGLCVNNVKKTIKMLHVETKVRWKDTDMLFVDEFSMLSDQVFEVLDRIGKEVRDSARKPFGGLRLVLSGDPRQLPAVKRDSCFNTKSWDSCNFLIIDLNKPYRYCPELTFTTAGLDASQEKNSMVEKSKVNEMKQQNFTTSNQQFNQDACFEKELNEGEIWFSLLLRLRNGECTGNDVLMLQKRVKTPKYMELLENKIWESFKINIMKANSTSELQNQLRVSSVALDCVKTSFITHIFTTKKRVADYNNSTLNRIESPEILLVAQDTISVRPDLTNKAREKLNDIIPGEIVIKLHAYVLITVNIREFDLCNGTTGIVIRYDEKHSIITIKLNDGTCRFVHRHKFVEKFGNKEVYRLQHPLVLAYALTAHKTQGSEFNRAAVYINRCELFTPGHVYVMLSRVKQLKNLFIVTEDLDTNLLNKCSDVGASFYKNNTQRFASAENVTSEMIKLAREHIDKANKMFLSPISPSSVLQAKHVLQVEHVLQAKKSDSRLLVPRAKRKINDFSEIKLGKERKLLTSNNPSIKLNQEIKTRVTGYKKWMPKVAFASNLTK